MGVPGSKWAYLLMEREANGERLNPHAARTWREALGYAATIAAGEALAQAKEKAA